MITISAKKLAEIVDGKLSNIPEEFVVDQLPLINSKLATNGTFLLPLKALKLMDMILFLKQLKMDQHSQLFQKASMHHRY